jgi:hypothetical protein
MNPRQKLDIFFCANYNRTVDYPTMGHHNEYEDKSEGIKKRKQREIGGKNGARGPRGTQYQCGT